ncbi:MAG: hypothetical protein J6K81_07170 [Rikenellaceae bacterium]|nr:hypothetical protein [Rikenellaceae bacterium]
MDFDSKLAERGYAREIYYQEFDRPYLYTSYDEYREWQYITSDTALLAKINFDTHSLIAITGLASFEIKNIKPTLTKYGNRYHLNIRLELNETARAARKWNLFIKAPKIKQGTKITSYISPMPTLNGTPPDRIASMYYNKDTEMNHKGGMTILQEPSNYHEEPIEVSPFLITYKKENHKKVLDAVNAHLTATLDYRHKTSPIGPMDSLSNYYCNVVRRCSYEDFILPNKDLFQIAYSKFRMFTGHKDSYTFPNYNWYCTQPGDTRLRTLLDYLNCQVVEGPLGDYIIIDQSKIHYWDLLSILGRHYYGIHAMYLSLQRQNSVCVDYTNSVGTGSKIHFDF